MSINGDETYCLCVNLRAVNKLATPDTYPLPRIEETLDRLGNCKYFTTLDMRSGYHQIVIAPEDRRKIAFAVPSGLYEFLRAMARAKQLHKTSAKQSVPAEKTNGIIQTTLVHLKLPMIYVCILPVKQNLGGR